MSSEHFAGRSRPVPRSLSSRGTCLDSLSGRQKCNSCARESHKEAWLRARVTRRGVTKPPADARRTRWQLRRHALCIFALRAAVHNARSYTTRSSHWKRDGVVTNPERTEIASPLPRQYLTGRCIINALARRTTRGRVLALARLEMREYAILYFAPSKRSISMRVSL